MYILYTIHTHIYIYIITYYIIYITTIFLSAAKHRHIVKSIGIIPNELNEFKVFFTNNRRFVSFIYNNNHSKGLDPFFNYQTKNLSTNSNQNIYNLIILLFYLQDGFFSVDSRDSFYTYIPIHYIHFVCHISIPICI